VRGGQVRIARQGLWGKDMEDVTQGGHGRMPCMRAVRRS
jgi:hypothetical protein